MALNYQKCAEEIVSHIGGRENIAQAAHCATRLRLVIKDNSKIEKDALENIDGVKGMFESNGQLQLIIGTGTVNKVYDEFLKVTGMTAATKDDVKAAAAAKQPVWRQMLKALGDVFVPILPAIVASGLLMGVIEALGRAIPTFSQTDWYAWLDLISGTAFAFLPVIVAISAARVFGGNIFLGAVVGLSLVHSSLLNGWNVTSTDAINSFFGITDGVIPTWQLLIFSVRRVGYQGHVIPIIISVWLMCQIEKWLHKHTPETLDLFIVPLCTVLSSCFLTFTIIGPIFSQLESWVLAGAEVLVHNPIGALVMGAIYPFTVVMGLHHMYNIIEAGMLASTGLNTWMPIASAANFAQFGACLAVGLSTKNQRTKVLAVPSSLSASLGITEPAIFGVNMRFLKPFIAGVIGGAMGALFGAITGIGATSYGVTGIPGYLTIDHPLPYTILLIISGGLAFIITKVIWHEEAKATPDVRVAIASQDKNIDSHDTKGESLKESSSVLSRRSYEALNNDFYESDDIIISSSAGNIYRPLAGEVIDYTDIADPTFSSGMMGKGVGINPDGETVYSPFDGEISTVAESGHAIGISGENDQELLIHVGIDTVEMSGNGFEVLVAEGDKVVKGQPLLRFSREKIMAAGHPDVVVVLLTNSDDYENVKTGIQPQ